MPSSDGILPVNLLAPTAKNVRFVNPLISDGMLPVNEFLTKSNLVSPLSSPNSGGMLPVNGPLTRARSDLLILLNSPIVGLRNSSLVTRFGVPLTVTPSQLVIAVPVLQFNDPVPRSVSFATSNTSQSCANPELVLGLDTAEPSEHTSTTLDTPITTVVVTVPPRPSLACTVSVYLRFVS